MAPGGLISNGEVRRPWYRTYSKLKFFDRLLRLVRRIKKKTHSKNGTPITQHEVLENDFPMKPDISQRCVLEEIMPSKSLDSFENEKYKIEPEIIDDAVESRRRGLEVQQAVKHIHFGSVDSKYKAASLIETIAKNNTEMKKFLATLGVVPPLVTMLDCAIDEHRSVALQALIELCNRSYTNKALFVEAGGVEKLGRLFHNSDIEMRDLIAIALLAISALDRNKSIIGSSAALPVLICMLETGNEKGRMASLAALYNLSTCLENVDPIAKEGAIQPLLNMVQSSKSMERSLAILANLVLVESGRASMSNAPTMPKCLIDVLRSDSTTFKCQERVAYILMVLAHRSLNQRQAMMRAGIVPVLLEVALLGTPLSQKRSLRILQYLRQPVTVALSGPLSTGRIWNKYSAGIVPVLLEVALLGTPLSQKRSLRILQYLRQPVTVALSGPLSTGRIWNKYSALAFPENDSNITHEMKEHKRAVKTMVEQSLDLNMERIMRRANVTCISGESSKLYKSLVNSSSSKSLPY